MHCVRHCITERCVLLQALAQKALNGRLFGESTVQATFFEEAKFESRHF